MFHRGSIVVRILLALIVLGGFVMASALSYRVGLARGYAQGAATTDSEETALLSPFPAPPAFFAPVPPRMGFFPFPLLGPLFCGGILFLMVLVALLRPPFGHHPPMPMMPKHPDWPCGPWSEGKEEPAGGEPEKSEKR